MNFVQTLAAQITALLPSVQSRPFLVGICGWADTGKSTLARNVCETLRTAGQDADWISTDAFLKGRGERNALGITGYNPLSLDCQSLAFAIGQISRRQEYSYRPYDNRTGSKELSQRTLAPGTVVVVVEGIHALHPVVSSALHLRVFIESDEDVLRAMRIRANIKKRGMIPTEAAGRIDQELEDYGRFTRPNKAQAQVEVEVGLDFQYLVRRSTVGSLAVTEAAASAAHVEG